jgi:hypothetical protein
MATVIIVVDSMARHDFTSALFSMCLALCNERSISAGH